MRFSQRRPAYYTTSRRLLTIGVFGMVVLLWLSISARMLLLMH